MLGKRIRPKLEGLSREQRLKRNVTDLAASGDVSAARTQSVIDDIAAVDVEGFGSLSSSSRRDTSGTNIARNLFGKLRKQSWPPLYYADVTVLDPASGREVCPFVGFVFYEVMTLSYRSSIHKMTCADQVIL